MDWTGVLEFMHRGMKSLLGIRIFVTYPQTLNVADMAFQLQHTSFAKQGAYMDAVNQLYTLFLRRQGCLAMGTVVMSTYTA